MSDDVGPDATTWRGGCGRCEWTGPERPEQGQARRDREQHVVASPECEAGDTFHGHAEVVAAHVDDVEPVDGESRDGRGGVRPVPPGVEQTPDEEVGR